MVGGMPIGALVALSVTNASQAARHVIDMRLPRETLWSLLVLGCVFNAILFWISRKLTPPVPPEFADSVLELPAFMTSPLLVFVFAAGGLVIMIHLLHWIGVVLGGTGTLGDMLSAFVWMQFLRILAQLGSVVLLLISQPFAAIFSLVVMVLSLWITVNFINEGAKLGSLLKTIGLLVIVFFGFVLGLSLILTLTGLAPMMLDQNV